MLKPSRLFAIGVAVVVAVVAIPSSAYASIGDGSSTLWKNYSNNLCMGVAGGNSQVKDGTAIITWTCNGSADQTWILFLVDPNQPSGPYFIKNSVATSECLSVAAKSTSANARLVLWHCKAASDNQDQRWYLSGDRQSPYVYLWNYNSGLVATALNAGNGAPIAQEPQGNTWFPLDAWLSV
jgi:Ricin-type beta-trefoil lectin domain